MNEHRIREHASLGVRRDLRTSQAGPKRHAAPGVERRPWPEIEAMVEAGIIDEDERFELIGGEVVPMSPKGARHEMVKIELNEHLQKTKRVRSLWIVPETTLRLDDKSFVEPDFCVFPRSIAPGDHARLRRAARDRDRRHQPVATISAARLAPTPPTAFPKSGSSTRLRWSRACTSSLARRAIGAWPSSGQTTR